MCVYIFVWIVIENLDVSFGGDLREGPGTNSRLLSDTPANIEPEHADLLQRSIFDLTTPFCQSMGVFSDSDSSP